ncbi:hypothetical protein SAMD00019534_112190 [Acytostelium subglobosum LB1]|uniref:hypothetical protein n=1 Tax=Acytostelium subglobosum LB1 TaxID=1410327 RepID=UPI000644DAD1|nr:hypothetical protein SAMD00019534_112190 [Acytostelium subglobosum LB1]GAM28043.1 hypothetical protein SAMD00019534_112190 [Acytostelium subglobosum LB1]|eukprot:XP_012749002.1 hypothetical protein SAMD00019534_112190 [Acytostelium subglobosum LB1]
MSIDIPLTQTSSLSSIDVIQILIGQQDVAMTAIMYKKLYSPLSTVSFPPNITSMVFVKIGFYNSPITPGAIPDSVTDIILSSNLNYRLEPGSIPASVTSLRFGGLYNHRLRPGIMPSKLTKLKMGFGFKKIIMPGALPPSLTYLSTGGYNHPILPGMLPTSLLRLKCGFGFNQPVGPGMLPASLIELRFGLRFNHEIGSGVLPPRLLVLKYRYIMDIKQYSLEEVAVHDKRDDLWMVLDGKVYDCTKFVDEHPGGGEYLIDVAGTDATMQFLDNGHSDHAVSLLKDFYIGDCTNPQHVGKFDAFYGSGVKSTQTTPVATQPTVIIPTATNNNKNVPSTPSTSSNSSSSSPSSNAMYFIAGGALAVTIVAVAVAKLLKTK